MPASKRTAFWIHNPARYLLKWRYLYRLWRFKPEIIFIGDYHVGGFDDLVEHDMDGKLEDLLKD